MVDLTTTLQEVDDPAQRLALSLAGIRNGKITDPDSIAQVCRDLSGTGKSEDAAKLARRYRLNDVAAECDEAEVRRLVERGFGSLAYSYAKKAERKDLALDVVANGAANEYRWEATRLAHELGDPRMETLLEASLKGVRDWHQRWVEHPHNFSPSYGLFFNAADLCRDVGKTNQAKRHFLRGVALAVKCEAYDKAIEKLNHERRRKEWSSQEELFDKTLIEKMKSRVYVKAGNHVLAARSLKEAGEEGKAQKAYEAARPALLALKYDNGVSIAENEMGDTELAFQIMKGQAESGSNWGRFARCRQAAEKARELGKGDEADRLYELAVASGLRDDPGPYDLDGATYPHDIVKWSHEFKGPEATLEVYKKLGWMVAAVEYAAENKMVDAARELAAPLFDGVNREGQVGVGLRLAKAIDDKDKIEFYEALQ